MTDLNPKIQISWKWQDGWNKIFYTYDNQKRVEWHTNIRQIDFKVKTFIRNNEGNIYIYIFGIDWKLKNIYIYMVLIMFFREI